MAHLFTQVRTTVVSWARNKRRLCRACRPSRLAVRLQLWLLGLVLHQLGQLLDPRVCLLRLVLQHLLWVCLLLLAVCLPPLLLPQLLR